MANRTRATNGGPGTTRRPWHRGILAGLVAGVAMGLFAMMVAAGTGPGFWAPMRLISGLFLGPDAWQAGVGGVLLGMMIHLVMSMVFGIIFAALLPSRAGIAGAVAGGFGYGIAIYLVMTFLVLPWVNPLMYNAIDKGWFLLSHLAYGITLGLVVPTRQRTEARGRTIFSPTATRV